MKQEITSEKKKELELKLKKSMLNFKMFSLMKKQLFSLVMMLALIVIASTSAWAQAGLTIPNAVWHLQGSTHNLTVADAHTGTTFSWVVFSDDGTGAAGGQALPTFTDNTLASVEFEYPDNAAGLYRFEVTETANSCSTVRIFYTAVMNINILVTASNLSGTELTAAGDLATCNDYAAITGGNLVANTIADLHPPYLNAAWFNTRYVTVTLSVTATAGTGTVTTAAPTAAALAWQFDFTIADAAAGPNYEDNFLSATLPTGVTGTSNAVTGTLEVEPGHAVITLPLVSNVQWGLTDTDEDQAFTFHVENAVVDDDTTPYDYTDGGESAANELLVNTSAIQLINASPATPVITIDE